MRGLESRLFPCRAIDELLEWGPERKLVQTDGAYGDITRSRVGLEQCALEHVPSRASPAEPSMLRDLVLAAGADGGAPGDLAGGTAAP